MSKLKLCIFISFISLLVCCSQDNGGSYKTETKNFELENVHKLLIKLPSAQSRSVTYYTLEDVSYYSVTVTFDGETITNEQAQPGDTVSVTVKNEGCYYVSVRAFNDEDGLIGEGDAEAYVNLELDEVEVIVTVTAKVKSSGTDLNISVVWSVPTTTTTTSTTTTTTVASGLNYTVEFNANGGIGTMESQEMITGVYYRLSSNVFTREGYGFIGWNTNASASTVRYRDYEWVRDLSNSEGATVTLYAVWGGNYSIAYNANGGTGTMESQSMTYGISGQLSQNDFTRDGYVFRGWNKDPNALTVEYANKEYVSDLTNIQGTTVTLYALWYLPAICYSDGTYSRTVDTNKTPVGIAIETDNTGKPIKMIHLKQNENWHIQWCIEYANAYGMELNTSQTDGSGNWQIICDAVLDETVTGHYPAFEYVNGLTEYGGGWYMPAIDELNIIFQFKDDINEALLALSDAGFEVDMIFEDHWLSSSTYGQCVLRYDFYRGRQENWQACIEGVVRAIRTF